MEVSKDKWLTTHVCCDIRDAPELSDWKCELFDEDCITYTPKKGREPNWFHRKMQGLILDFKWTKKATDPQPKNQAQKR